MGLDVVLAIFFSFIIGVIFGSMVILLTRGTLANRQIRLAQKRAARVIAEAQKEAEAITKEAERDIEKRRDALEQENRSRREELQRQEVRLTQKEANLEHKLERVAQQEREFIDKERQIEQGRAQLEELRQQEMEQLESVAKLSAEEAKRLVLERIDEEMRSESSRRLHEWEEKIRQEADARAQEIILQAIQRSAAEVVSESTLSVVPIPSEDMKGRLIGREGRNIRALEQATGVDLIIDDTPDAVTLSGFDPVRREVARLALTRLIADGRIHPARIEEVVEKAREEVAAGIQKAGEEAVYEVGLHGLHPELIKLLGRLKYRTSYGQNVLAHSIEVAYLAAMMAAELNLNVNLAKKAGLLHDIGKAVDREVEGTHASIGAELVKQWEKSPEVIKGIAEHHLDTGNVSIWGFLISAADAISGARPGARREDLEGYIKRLRSLEDIASSFPGVEKTYAIKAGREVRIMVKPQEIDDLTATRMSRDIAKKVEETLQYPGQIKVVVIRETRAIDYAK